jgi:hypothetical protein
MSEQIDIQQRSERYLHVVAQLSSVRATYLITIERMEDYKRTHARTHARESIGSS